ncbi:hypothetical protein IC582_002104 [Cucumis melo]
MTDVPRYTNVHAQALRCRRPTPLHHNVDAPPQSFTHRLHLAWLRTAVDLLAP